MNEKKQYNEIYSVSIQNEWTSYAPKLRAAFKLSAGREVKGNSRRRNQVENRLQILLNPLFMWFLCSEILVLSFLLVLHRLRRNYYMKLVHYIFLWFNWFSKSNIIYIYIHITNNCALNTAPNSHLHNFLF